MELDASTLRPTKPKHSHLKVISMEKRRAGYSEKASLLGRADLDLTEYGDGIFKSSRLVLQECSGLAATDGAAAYIEIGLKGIAEADPAAVATSSNSNRSFSSPFGSFSDESGSIKKFSNNNSNSAVLGLIENMQ